MLKTAVALRQLPVKTSARWLSNCGDGDGVRVREKMSEDDINDRRLTNISNKIWAEYRVLDCYDDSFLKPERCSSENFEERKSFYNDLKKYNRKNGIVPPRLQHLQPMVPAMHGYIPDSWKPRKDDTEVIESAQLAVKEYNKQHGSSLEFLSVLSVEGRSIAHCNFVIQTRDPAAAGVSIRLVARCSWTYDRVNQVLLQRPVSSINLLRKDERNKTDAGAVEALLYANLRNCPLITRRLGLKRQDAHYDNFRGTVRSLSLDDDSLVPIAQFAVNQRSDLHFLRVTGAWREEKARLAWREEMVDRRYLYHLSIEALEDGRERRFYSAISVNEEGADAKLVDLVALDSPKHTIK